MGKTYKFPDKAKRITRQKMKEVLCQYDKVEIPGSIMKLKIDTSSYDADVKAKEIVLHEGTTAVSLVGASPIKYNIPKSLIDLEVIGEEYDAFQAPKVLCLPSSFRNGSGLRGVEYLQVYNTSNLRGFWLKDLKHYVYLGEKSPRYRSIFDVTPGCVIHVENKRVARAVMKRCDLEKVYVVPDAAEWKDFPADKLAVSMEEYDPESRILPEQKELRLKQKEHRIKIEQFKQGKEIQYQKEAMLTRMVNGAASQVLDDLGVEYKLNVYKRPKTTSVHLSANVTPGLKVPFQLLFNVDIKIFKEKIDDIAHHISRFLDYYSDKCELFKKYEVSFCPSYSDLGLTLRLIDKCYISAKVTEENVCEVAAFTQKVVKDFNRFINGVQIELGKLEW